MPSTRHVAVVTLGCARNDVDSEELAGRLGEAGWQVDDDPTGADVVLVNTCGFIEAAKRESIDAVLAAADSDAKVVAVGCLAERYGATLAAELPEATVLGFDDYDEISDRLNDVLAGRPITPHTPVDRRSLLPVSPAARVKPAPIDTDHLPAHLVTPRRRLGNSPIAPLKIASGCDRRCAFCAIPTFRGAFVSRDPETILAEARWLAGGGVKEVVLVSENTTSYGKDLSDLAALDKLLVRLAELPGLARVRCSYLQPAELRPGLIETIAGTAGVAPYFDLSFQHASASVLRRMRRFGDPEKFLDLIERIRQLAPAAGIRTNVIVGFPGETDDDVATLMDFIGAARLDAVGVFGYSDEDGTEAADFADKIDAGEIDARVSEVAALADDVAAARAAERIGETVEVLITEVEPGQAYGNAAHQASEVDGQVVLGGAIDALRPGDMVAVQVTSSDGVDLGARV